jgi:excisionase family DNA binding protein
MLRVADIASYLDISLKAAYQLVKQPGFPLIVLTNKSWRIPRDAFCEWMEAQPGIKALIEARAVRATQDDSQAAHEAATARDRFPSRNRNREPCGQTRQTQKDQP